MRLKRAKLISLPSMEKVGLPFPLPGAVFDHPLSVLWEGGNTVRNLRLKQDVYLWVTFKFGGVSELSCVFD